MNARMMAVTGLVGVLVTTSAVADVFNMGSSLTSLETVPVGNTGNTGQQSGLATFGDTTYYGAVDYEYNIGKYEVTAGQYCEFLNAVAATDTYGLYNPNMWDSDYGCKIERYAGSGTAGDPYQYRVANDWANRPVNYVSWGDAARFANWLHNGQPTGAQDLTTTEDGAYYLNGAITTVPLMAVVRKPSWKWAIPTEDEWYKAAYHKSDGVTGNYWDYPTCSDSGPSNALVDPDPGNNATWEDENAVITRLTIDSPYYRTEVGAHENSDSRYGTFDQGGNVWEWNEAIVDASSRGLRGAAFCSPGGTYGNVLMHAGIRGAALNPGNEDGGFFGHEFAVGFRVSEVPEPTTLSLLALGWLATLRRK